MDGPAWSASWKSWISLDRKCSLEIAMDRSPLDFGLARLENYTGDFGETFDARRVGATMRDVRS